MQQIEEEGSKRNFAASPRNIEALPKTTHRGLERMRSAVLSQRDHFAIEDELPSGQSANQLHHLRHRSRHVVEPPGVHCHLVSTLVDLNARAIELVLQRSFSQLADRLRGVLRGTGQHRMYRAEELGGKAR